MHINNDFNNDIKTRRNAPYQEIRESSAKESEPVQNGDILKGKVVDINSDKVSVRLESGEMITAKLPTESHGSGLGEVKIGDNINLRVSEKNGQQSLELIVSKSNARQNIIGMALNAAGLKLTEENAKLIELLLTNQKPIDANTIKKFNQALKLVGQENVNQALFILDNDMPVTKGTAEKVEQYVNREQNIKYQFSALEQAINEMESGPLKDRLIKILSEENKSQNLVSATTPDTELLSDETAIEFKTTNGQKSPLQQTAATVTAAVTEELPLVTAEKMSETASVQKQPQESQALNSISEPMKQAVKASVTNMISLLENFEGTSEQKLEQFMLEFEKTPMGKLVMKNINSTDDFKSLLKIVSEGDSSLAEKISELIQDDTAAEEIVNKEAPEKSSKRLPSLGLLISKDSTPKELEDFYNNTLDKLNNIKEALSQSGSPSANKILSAASDIEKNLEFFNSVKNEIYLQMPVIINNIPTQSELFIFKDKKGGKKTGNTKSALIALDLLNLGHFETYIQKTGNKVNLQFRLENQEVEKLVKLNINKLNILLQEKNLLISAVSYKTTDEPFSLVESEPSFSDNIDNEEANTKRISFDMRM